jgi:hypothetical protein
MLSRVARRFVGAEDDASALAAYLREIARLFRLSIDELRHSARLRGCLN